MAEWGEVAAAGGGEVLYEEKGVGKIFGMIQVPGDSSRDLSIP